MQYVKKILFAIVAMAAGILFLFETAYAKNTPKPLNDWAKVQITVCNSDYDNVIHFDISYDLDSLYRSVIWDGGVDIGHYLNRWRGYTSRSFFTEYAINKLLQAGYLYEDEKYVDNVFWTDYALDVIKDLEKDKLYNELRDSGNILTHSKIIDSYSRAKNTGAIHQITYFWVCLFRVDPPSKFINDWDDNNNTEGGEAIRGYYWGVFAKDTGNSVHSYLTIPESVWIDINGDKMITPDKDKIEYHGPGKYRIYIMARLGTWDYSYYNSTGIDGWVAGQEFQAKTFGSVLPIPSGAKIKNPDGDASIRIEVPALANLPNYNPDFPPHSYIVEITSDIEPERVDGDPAWPWPAGKETDETVVVYYEIPKVDPSDILGAPKTPDEPLFFDIDVRSLATQNINTLYGRIGGVGPPLEYGYWWTSGEFFDMGPIDVTYWETLLTPPPSFDIVNDPVNKPESLDTTIYINIPRYPADVRHTGYLVEISNSGDFTTNFADYIYYNSPTNSAKDAAAIDKDKRFDVDLEAYRDELGDPLPSAVHVRLRAVKDGYIPSEPSLAQAVSIADVILLEKPQNATLLNPDGDTLVQLEVFPAGKRKTKETGYMVDVILGNQEFNDVPQDMTYRFFYSHYDLNMDGKPDEVELASLRFEVDLSPAVNAGIFSPSELKEHGVKIRISSTKEGFTGSEPFFAGTAPVKMATRLENPGGRVKLGNDDNDRVITITIDNYDPANFGKTNGSTLFPHMKDVRHTGYRIDVCKDENFSWEETYHAYYTYDFENDSIADEIKNSNPNRVIIPLDLELARNYIGSEFVDNGGTVYVRVLAIRAGYAVNYEDLPINSVIFGNNTRLENPGPRARVYNLQPENLLDKRGRTITVEIENYSPSGVASGNNLKDAPHTGYQIDISASKAFSPDKTGHYYYTYDPDVDRVPDEIGSNIGGSIKMHIDLDLAREIWEGEYSGQRIPTLYVRVFANRYGYAINYDELPIFSVPFLDIPSPLTPPTSAEAFSISNPNMAPDKPLKERIDSSIMVKIDETIPVDVVHDGYMIEIILKGPDGKEHRGQVYIPNLQAEERDVNPDPEIEELALVIPSIKHAIDVKRIFEAEEDDPTTPADESNMLRDFIGIPLGDLAEITVTVASIKGGYPVSVPVDAGTTCFRNTSDSFLPKPRIEIFYSHGTEIVLELPPYPQAPFTIPPYEDAVRYEIQYSSSKEFPKNVAGDIKRTTAYVRAPSPDEKSTIFSNNIAELLKTYQGKIIYARFRFLKEGYTPGPFSDIYEIVISEKAPLIIDFTADKTIGEYPLDVILAANCNNAITYIWDFGDGEEMQGENRIRHTYGKSGKYTVTLIAVGASGTTSDAVKKTDYIKVGDSVVAEGEFIQDAIDDAIDGTAIIIANGAYDENLIIEKEISLIGEDPYGTDINGSLTCDSANASIEDLTINGGIKAINSGILVKNCINRGGIEIWNLCGSGDLSPTIENNIILLGDIFLYSHANGGKMSGRITSNTFYQSGINIRMQKEDPLVTNNIIVSAGNAIKLTYSSLLRDMLSHVSNNCFFGNTHNIWCEELQAEQLPLQWRTNGNISEDPQFSDPASINFKPSNPDCQNIGIHGSLLK